MYKFKNLRLMKIKYQENHTEYIVKLLKSKDKKNFLKTFRKK